MTEISQIEWDGIRESFPPGTSVKGVVQSQEQYGVWLELDKLSNIPALLELIHFEVRETNPEKSIRFPIDYPAIGQRIEARILAWCEKPKDVRLTQLSHLDWSHRRFLREQEGGDV